MKLTGSNRAEIRVDIIGENHFPPVLLQRQPDQADAREEFGHAKLPPRGGLPAGAGFECC